jgi:hypothetical protein
VVTLSSLLQYNTLCVVHSVFSFCTVYYTYTHTHTHTRTNKDWINMQPLDRTDSVTNWTKLRRGSGIFKHLLYVTLRNTKKEVKHRGIIRCLPSFNLPPHCTVRTLCYHRTKTFARTNLHILILRITIAVYCYSDTGEHLIGFANPTATDNEAKT